jgi:hypothetical protein
MSYYWARFKNKKENTFRYDTRIYLNDIKEINNNDICIGAIVGKNPGSAKALNTNNIKIQPINLDGDKLLPTVRNIFIKSFKEQNLEVPKNSYIQVLNLFYLCDENLNRAIGKIALLSELELDDSEGKEFPLIWYVWGNENKKLNDFKKRFVNLRTNQHIFYNQKEKCISLYMPTTQCFAKHTQGLAHNAIIPHLSKLLLKQT